MERTNLWTKPNIQDFLEKPSVFKHVQGINHSCISSIGSFGAMRAKFTASLFKVLSCLFDSSSTKAHYTLEKLTCWTPKWRFARCFFSIEWFLLIPQNFQECNSTFLGPNIYEMTWILDRAECLRYFWTCICNEYMNRSRQIVTWWPCGHATGRGDHSKFKLSCPTFVRVCQWLSERKTQLGKTGKRCWWYSTPHANTSQNCHYSEQTNCLQESLQTHAHT